MEKKELLVVEVEEDLVVHSVAVVLVVRIWISVKKLRVAKRKKLEWKLVEKKVQQKVEKQHQKLVRLHLVRKR